MAKIRLNGEDKAAAQQVRQVLVWVMSRTLALLHPFMPYITEEIWQALPHEGEALATAAYPSYREELVFTEKAQQMESIMNAVRAVRNRRSEMNVPPSRKTMLYIASARPEPAGRFSSAWLMQPASRRKQPLIFRAL